ncbi:MAG: hypothetical protein IJ207_06875 [Treponema sp.]|uniref:hypothetical protein n=1 Tax=Treponema sp. TaxID=166 RepID=UPI0025F62F03|nr:hypothetical protein [Treponema sp.]MBQ9281907.1 hypothetical protein [Treponema sp.]
MKKIIWTMAIFAAISFALIGCSSVMSSAYTSTENISEYKSATGTPEDSVIFYGWIEGNEVTEFSQMNSELPSDFQQMKNSIFVSKPVAPGSLYFLQGMSGKARRTGLSLEGNIIWIYNEIFPMQSDFVPIIVNVPKEPGFYFVGYYAETIKLLEGDVKKSDNKSAEKICLKGALKLYKGTAWEKAIKDRIKEL